MHNWYILVPCKERATNPQMSRTRDQELHIKCIKCNQWLTNIPSNAPARNPRDNSSGLTKDRPLILQCIQKCSLHLEEEATRSMPYLRALLDVIHIAVFGGFLKLLNR